MNQALSAVTSRLKKKLSERVVPQFENHGQTHQLTCTEECMYAGAQRLRKIAELIQTEIQTEDNYYEEKVIAQLVILFTSYEKMTLQYAEIHQAYGESAVLVRELIPALELVVTDGHSMWKYLEESGLIEKK